jgi:hypothetical protein
MRKSKITEFAELLEPVYPEIEAVERFGASADGL